MRRNFDIELMRYLMIIAVAVLHFGEDYTGTMRTLKGGALGVDFFFLISGFYLAQHYYKNSTNESPIIQTNRYFIKRVQRLYPAYFISLTMISVIYWTENNYSIKWLIDHIWQCKWQYFFLHFLIPNVPFDLRSNWFMCCLVFSMFIIYFMMAYNEKLAMGLFPIGATIVLSHLYTTYGNITATQGAWEGWIRGGMLRGVSEMSIGAFMYNNVKYCQDNGINLNKASFKIIATIVKWLSVGMVFYFMYKYAVDANDFIKLALVITFIRLSYTNCYIINDEIVNSIVGWFGKISYWIFSIHLIISHLFCRFIPGREYYFTLILFLLSTTIIASVCQLAEDKIRAYRKRRTLAT